MDAASGGAGGGFGKLYLNQSTFLQNRAGSQGGVAYMGTNGVVFVTGCTIVDSRSNGIAAVTYVRLRFVNDYTVALIGNGGSFYLASSLMSYFKNVMSWNSSATGARCHVEGLPFRMLMYFVL